MKYASEVVALIVSALLVAAGWFGHSLYDVSVKDAIAETRRIAAQGAASEIAKLTITNTTVQGRIVERILTEKVYSECSHSPEAFQLIQDAFK